MPLSLPNRTLALAIVSLHATRAFSYSPDTITSIKLTDSIPRTTNQPTRLQNPTIPIETIHHATARKIRSDLVNATG